MDGRATVNQDISYQDNVKQAAQHGIYSAINVPTIKRKGGNIRRFFDREIKQKWEAIDGT